MHVLERIVSYVSVSVPRLHFLDPRSRHGESFESAKGAAGERATSACTRRSQIIFQA